MKSSYPNSLLAISEDACEWSLHTTIRAPPLIVATLSGLKVMMPPIRHHVSEWKSTREYLQGSEMMPAFSP